MTPFIEKEAIMPRIDGIRKNLKKLENLAALSFEDFVEGDAYDLAQHHLRLALEGLFHISSHILARLPGGRATHYKEVALKLGEFKIVTKSFAKNVMVPMAGMRNILVHAYADLDPKKLFKIIKNNRQDIETCLKHFKTVLKAPKKWGFTLK